PLSPVLLLNIPPPPTSTLFPYTTLFRSRHWQPVGTGGRHLHRRGCAGEVADHPGIPNPALCPARHHDASVPSGWTATAAGAALLDRKSTRLNSSHVSISYAVFCLKKKKE